MSNMKIISIMGRRDAAQAAAVDGDIHTMLAVVEDEIDGVRISRPAAN